MRIYQSLFIFIFYVIIIITVIPPHFWGSTNMKNTNELEMIEKKFCKLTRGFAHKHCPNDCPKKVTIKVAGNELSKEYKLRINRDRLYVYWVMEKGFKSEDGKYEVKKAMKECEFIRRAVYDRVTNSNSLQLNYEHRILKKLLKQVRNSLEKSTVEVIDPEPKSEIEAYRSSREYFADISDVRFNRLCEKIEDLIILDGKKWNKEISAELSDKFHLYRNDKEIIKYFWDSQLEKYKKMSHDEIEQLREIIKNRSPSKGAKKKEKERPFKFNRHNLLLALEKEIINKREARVLEYRFGLDGGGTRSLRLIAGWLEKSHTTIRNTEKGALQKMEDYMHQF